MIALLLFAAAPPAEMAGVYRLTGEPEVASELVLNPDGRFTYALSTGALDEWALGRWTAEGGRVRLTTEPKPVPPRFEPGGAGRTEASPLRLKVAWPDGRGIAGVDVRFGFDEGASTEGYTQEEGWSLAGTERRAPRWIELAVPMHGLVSARFPVDPAAGNDLAFTLVPNDLGIVDFDSMPLTVEPGRLVMERGGARLVYRKR
jgi:hypothetical protein